MTTTRLAAYAAAVLTLQLVMGCGKPPPPAAHVVVGSPFAAIARGRVDVEGGIVHIAPARDGIARTVEGKVGDTVKAGDVLIVLETTQFEFARDAAKADLATAEAQAALLRSRQGGLKVRASRAERAAHAGATSDQSADDARQALAELRLEIVAAQSGVEAAKQKVRQTEYEIAARTIRAPVAGKIVARNVRAGEVVSTSTAPLVDLLPDGPRIVRAELNEGFVSKVSVGMNAEVRSQADTGTTYPAQVVRIGDIFGPSKLAESSQDATDARDVECILDIGSAPLRIGERVQVAFPALSGQ